MEKNDIVKLVVVGLAALLLPLFLVIPTIPFTVETFVSLGGGLVAFYLITGLTARKGWKKWIFLMPLALIAVVAISYIPFSLSGWQLLGYYILVVVALAVSVGSHLLEWWKERKSTPRRRRRSDEDE